MSRVLWLTDIHLNFLSAVQVDGLVRQVADLQPDAVLIGGDIGESDSVAADLVALTEAWTFPVYFVLGNHDFYGGSIQAGREEMTRLSQSMSSLTYLTASDTPVTLAPGVGLIGHDGWADARAGDYLRSLVMMNDYRLIDELKPHDKSSRLSVLQDLGDEAADHISRQLRKAVVDYSRILVLTHVPPYREACWYDGQPSNDEWAPHFSCMAVGHAIEDVMRRHPEVAVTVLCGHTHSGGEYQRSPNIFVKTGAAEYGTVALTEVLELAGT